MGFEVITFVKSSWVNPMWKRFGKITGEQKKELDGLRDEFVDPEVYRGLYIEPYFQDRNPADAHQDELISAAQQPAFERINGFLRGELPLEKDGRHQMFILSDAGMGKTSLLLMIKLMHLTSFWPRGYNCALFKLGEDTLERVAVLKNKGETVLLLDALDEDPKSWKRIRERLLELLLASEDFRRVIISSRTQFFPEMEPDRLGRAEIKVLSGYHCPVLYLSPFSDEQVQEFIQRKLPLRWYYWPFLQSRIKKKRAKATVLLEHMQDLRMRPMLLQHIDKLLAVECQQEWNAYTVYEALVDEWLNREVRKIRGQYKDRRVPERKELFHACLRVAEAMERQGVRIIGEDGLQQLVREDENIGWVEKFELGGRSLLNRNSERAFRFSHYTIQEFMLAWGIVNEQLAEQKPVHITGQLLHFLELSGQLPDRLHLIDIEIVTEDFSIAVRLFASCKTVSHIALLSNRIDWIAKSLTNKAGNHVLSCLKLSQDVRSALKSSTLFRRKQRLKEVETKINDQRNRLDILHDNEASAFSSILDNWYRIIEAACTTLHNSIQEDFEIRQVYLPGQPLEPDKAGSLFKGRRDLFHQIESLLFSAQPPTLVMQGGRRSGKSSVLRYLPKQMPSDILPLFVDCQGMAVSSTLPGLARHLAHQIIESSRTTHRLTLPPPNEEELACDPFASLLEWLETIEQAVPGKTFLLCLDEFERIDQIVTAAGSYVPLNFLRHLIQHRRRWLLLFAGSHTPEELAPHWSDCLINTRSLRVSFLDKDDAVELIRRPVEGFPEIWLEAAVEEVWQLTQGQPYYIQLIGQEVIELLNREKRRQADAEDVMAVLPTVFVRGHYVFDEFWRALSEEQRTLLIALAEGKAVPPNLHTTAALIRKEILAQENDGWSFRVPLIQQWIIRNG
ncbi:NACHT domain-containing protein [Candidatus Electrothrix sp.]|uniref:NACHT domain-containing protein n=1 Tax=Candidatus Electrothrix sp. TaxID=2170559 RepID=UPI0040563163